MPKLTLQWKLTSLFARSGKDLTQHLWKRVPWHLWIEILQHFDVRSYQRLKRVSKRWSLDMSRIVQHNSGAVFVTFKHIRWPKEWPRQEWLAWIDSKVCGMSWSEFLGCDVTKVRHIVCDEEILFEFWCHTDDGSVFHPTLNFSTFSHRLNRITLIKPKFLHFWDLFDCRSSKVMFDYMEGGRAAVELILAENVEEIVFIDMRINLRTQFKELWLMDGEIPGIEGYSFLRPSSNLEQMWDVPYCTDLVVPHTVFNLQVFDYYRYGPEKCFLYLPWFCDVLVNNDLLWKYPPQQTEWLQRCMDILPPTPKIKANAMEFWTRDAVRKRLKYRKLWREQLRVPENVFPKTDVHFEEYCLDTFDCEIFANWFVMTKDWFSRFLYYKRDETFYGRIPFASIHPDYPCIPFSMAGPKPEADNCTDTATHSLALHCWERTRRAETNYRPRPGWEDLISAYRIKNPRICEYYYQKKGLWGYDSWRQRAIWRWLGLTQPEDQI